MGGIKLKNDCTVSWIGSYPWLSNSQVNSDEFAFLVLSFELTRKQTQISSKLSGIVTELSEIFASLKQGETKKKEVVLSLGFNNLIRAPPVFLHFSCASLHHCVSLPCIFVYGLLLRHCCHVSLGSRRFSAHRRTLHLLTVCLGLGCTPIPVVLAIMLAAAAPNFTSFEHYVWWLVKFFYFNVTTPECHCP